MIDLVTTTKHVHEAREYASVNDLMGCPLVEQLIRNGHNVRPVAVTQVTRFARLTIVGFHAYVWEASPFWSGQIGMIAKVQD